MLVKLLSGIILILLLSSCPSAPLNLQEKAEVAEKELLKKTEKARENQKAIQGIVDDAISKDSVKELPRIKPLTGDTIKQVTDVDVITVELAKIIKYQSELILELEKKNKELEDANSFKHKLPWVLLFVGGIAVAIGIYFNRHKCTIAGLAVGGCSFGVHAYYDLLEKFLPAMLIIGVCFIIGAVVIHLQEKKETQQ